MWIFEKSILWTASGFGFSSSEVGKYNEICFHNPMWLFKQLVSFIIDHANFHLWIYETKSNNISRSDDCQDITDKRFRKDKANGKTKKL